MRAAHCAPPRYATSVGPEMPAMFSRYVIPQWAAVFYLITTDILGPFNAPFALSQTGYVPGVILYFFMGAVACYTGLLLWYLFLKLDSELYPVKTYSDLTERIFGRVARYGVDFLQSLQLIVNVGTICLSNGQSLSQIAAGPSGTGTVRCSPF